MDGVGTVGLRVGAEVALRGRGLVRVGRGVLAAAFALRGDLRDGAVVVGGDGGGGEAGVEFAVHAFAHEGLFDGAPVVGVEAVGFVGWVWRGGGLVLGDGERGLDEAGVFAEDAVEEIGTTAGEEAFEFADGFHLEAWVSGSFEMGR